jgi:hypothetical protein
MELLDNILRKMFYFKHKCLIFWFFFFYLTVLKIKFYFF